MAYVINRVRPTAEERRNDIDALTNIVDPHNQNDRTHLMVERAFSIADACFDTLCERVEADEKILPNSSDLQTVMFTTQAILADICTRNLQLAAELQRQKSNPVEQMLRSLGVPEELIQNARVIDMDGNVKSVKDFTAVPLAEQDCTTENAVADKEDDA